MFRVISVLISMLLLNKVQGDHHEDRREFIFERQSGYMVTVPSGKDVKHWTEFVRNDLECAFRCAKQKWCNSANFELVSENQRNGLQLCELLSTDEKANVKYLEKDDKFVHLSFKILNHPCQKQPCSNEGTCIKVDNRGGFECRCINGFSGKFCQQVSSNCSELLDLSIGFAEDGVYYINPDGQGSFPVYCDMTTDGGGWTVFQRNRKDSPTSFNHNWQGYKTGFGNLTGEFWLGLDKIYRLTKTQATSLRVDLEDFNGNKRYAEYSSFSVADESDFYRLLVSGYSGTAGDSIGTAVIPDYINNNMRFSTPDKDNDLFPSGSCAVERNSGWWYNLCTISDLNGDKTWWSFSKTLKNTEIKLR